MYTFGSYSKIFFLIHFSGWVSWVGLWSQLNILMFFFFLFIYWTKLISLKKNHVGFLFYWFFLRGFGATMGRKFWFLWMPTMKDLCNLCLLESMLNSWFVNKLFDLFLFCKQTAEEQRLHLRSSMYDVAFLIWFTAFVCLFFEQLNFANFYMIFFVHNSHRIVPPYHKILHNYWLLVLLCILVFTKCNGREIFLQKAN